MIKTTKKTDVTVIGAGLAGSEAAWQLARAGLRVRLCEMKPIKRTDAHHSDNFAELVCSNSFRSDDIGNAAGLLKEELRRLGSFIMTCADVTRVPAGSALAVDREMFSAEVTKRLQDNKNIVVDVGEVTDVPNDTMCLIATGPLTSPALFDAIAKIIGDCTLHFFDAAAPIIVSDTIDRSVAFAMSRYEKTSADYLNCPMNKDEYHAFWHELVAAGRAPVKDFDKQAVFEGCMPIETMAERGIDTMRFGPLKPVGLIDPRTGKMPYACVQLRQDNRAASMYNMVGFQTRLSFSEQRRVFRMIPGLRAAEFFRMGVMHKNTYLDSPRLLDATYRLISHPHIYFAGQITGVEGYIESVASGWLSAYYIAGKIKGLSTVPLSEQTMIGAMAAYVSDPRVSSFTPMNANAGLLMPLSEKIKSKTQRKVAYAQRSLNYLDTVKNDMMYVF